MKKQKIPSGLKKQGQAFWKKINSETIFEDSYDIERLLMAAKTLDEISIAEVAMKKTGMFIKDRYGSLREHPACKTIRDNKIIFCRIIRELGLDIEQPEDPRLPRQY